MFARRPVRSRAPRILAVAVACGLAPIGCERTPTGSSGPSGAIADPTLLPVASGQAPSPAAYDALLVANQPAGFSYNDPVTNVKIWKVTSSVVPAANTSAGHDYADGGNRASLGWGSSSNTHTILIRGDGMDYHLVDFIRGVGFSNYRRLPDAAQPDRDLCFSFSNRPSQPRIAYVVHSGVLHRLNTETMQLENTGSFPRSVRSEERRVGKECRTRWAAGLEKKKMKGREKAGTQYTRRSVGGLRQEDVGARAG